MRRFYLFVLLLPLAFCLLAAPAPAAQSQEQRLTGEFESLCGDASRGKRRDLWLELEKKFQTLESKSKGEAAAKAAFYQARTRQELARRSFLDSDRSDAARCFARVADRYGKFAPARESLYQQAVILKDLGDKAGAQKALKRLSKAYPSSKEAAKGRQMLAALEGGPATGQARTADQARTQAQAARQTGERQTQDGPALVRDIRWQGTAKKAKVILELDRSAAYSYAYLPGDAKAGLPARVYLDLAKTSSAPALKASLSPQNLLVTRIRSGKTERGLRITLECAGVARYAVRSPKDAAHLIEIDLSRGQDIEGGLAVNNRAAARGGAGKTAGSAESSSRPAATGKSGGPASVIEQLGLTVKTIMLDAGHGGKDPGAQHNGIVERRFTLNMARRLGALLEKKGFNVLYTRTGNNFISLQDRPDMANQKKADLFISLHVNANAKSAVRGLETYYLDEAKSDDAVTVAARENAVSVKNISDLQFILTDLMLGSKLKESHKLADCVHRGILAGLRAAKLPAHSNGVRSAPFYVLMGARMPAILVEFGYITNQGDAKNLKNDAFLQRQAEGLVNGILNYKAEVAKMAP
ncbi:N-acetylmuramoyl-L-alanine amidase [Desulfovibrio sp. OttesenSCG-928-G11]|nr:N-acetylmuramoyl-L-alanine amidase [Desulfovibrio sp. OttesenSCG-928-G11]